MKSYPVIAAALAVLLLGTPPAHAACVIEYKAKRDNPLKLFQDVATVDGECNSVAVTPKLEQMLAKQGLTLLKILSIKEQ